MYWTHTGKGTTSKKSIQQELLKFFSSIKASKDWTIVKYLYNSYPWVLMIILVNTILRNLYIYLVILCCVTLYILCTISMLLYLLILCAEIYVLLVQNNYTSSYFYKCVHIISFFSYNAHKDIKKKKCMCR
jgi:hypothetical protein